MVRTGLLLLLFLGIVAGRANAQAMQPRGTGDAKPKYEWPRSAEDDKRELAYAQKRGNRERAIRAYVEVANSQDASLRAEAEKLLEKIPAEDKAGPYVKLLEHPYHLVRTYMAQHIAALKNDDAVAALFKVALGDVYAPAREAAVHALVDQIGPQETVLGLGEAAWSDESLARIRAMEGIGKAGYSGGVEILVTRMKITYGGGARSYFFHAEQRAYIKDYDVEIATSAAAYDPIIGTVSDGVVLETKVLRIDEEMTIIEKRVLNGAMEGLTGIENKKGDPNAWLAWWEAHQDDPKWHVAAK